MTDPTPADSRSRAAEVAESWWQADAESGNPDRPLEYDPDNDNCAGSPGCGDQRVLFTWFHMPAACCPRCYENIFAAPPGPSLPIVKISVAA